MGLINYIPEGKGGGLQSLVFLISFQFLVQICVSNPIGTSQSLDPIRNDYEEGVDPSFIRTKREPGAVNSDYVPGESMVEFTGGRMIRRRQTGTENVVDTYKPVKKLDYSHPYRKKVKPVEKPITPYFVRILKRRPVGLSAMNYTTPDDHAFENSDNGEIIDVPKVLVDRRRNKNVDSIHPIYVVENDDEDQEQEAQVSKAVLQNSQDVQQLLPVNTSYLFIPTSNEPKVFTEPNSPPTTTTTTTIPPETTTVPVLKFRRLMRFKPRDYTTATTEETRTTTDYPSYATETSQDLASNSTTSNHSDTIDYLPLEFDYERDPQNYTIKSLVTDPTTSTTNVPSMKFRAYDMETIRNNRKRVLTQNVPSPQTVVLSRVPHRLENLPVPVPQVSTTVPPAGNPGLLGDYGYGGVVIGGGVRDRATMDSEHVIEQVSTTSIPVTTRAPVTTTTTTTAVPTTTTTTTTEVPTTTTTTTTTTTEEPTTTSTSTTSTTTTTTTSTTPMPVALRMRMRETPTTTVPSTLPTAEPLTNLMTMTDDQLLTELMAKIPKDADLNEELTPEQATTLQQMILAHLLNSTPVTLSPQESVKFTKTPQDYQDLQTAASSTTGLFTTRADVGSSGGAGVTNAIVQTTTKNPLLQFFDNLAGHSQQQQQRSAPSSQASSFVRPIQEVNSSGGRADANKPPEFSMGDILRMMIQLPGNILVGVLRFMRTTGEFLGGIMNGVMKMLSGIANAGSGGGGGLFNG